MFSDFALYAKNAQSLVSCYSDKFLPNLGEKSQNSTRVAVVLDVFIHTFGSTEAKAWTNINEAILQVYAKKQSNSVVRKNASENV